MKDVHLSQGGRALGCLLCWKDDMFEGQSETEREGETRRENEREGNKEWGGGGAGERERERDGRERQKQRNLHTEDSLPLILKHIKPPDT